MKASPVAMGMVGAVGTAAGDRHEDADDGENGQVDEPEGFGATAIAGSAGFVDDVAAMFTLEFGDTEETAETEETHGTESTEEDTVPIGTHLEDASNLVFPEVNWEPEGTSGWHRHPGPVLVSVVEGELELEWRVDGVTRTYAAGEAFLDPGATHVARNPSSDEGAKAYALALGIPEDQPVTEWVEEESG